MKIVYFYNLLNRGSLPHGKLIERDFTIEKRKDFTIRKEILFESETATQQEINKKEIEFILKYNSNNPTIGYNKRLKK